MADKHYKITFDMADGSTKDVEFTAPQGEPGTAGKGAYQCAVDGGYKGSENEFNHKLAQTSLVGTTNGIKPLDVYVAMNTGVPVRIEHADSVYGVVSFNYFAYSMAVGNMIVSSVIFEIVGTKFCAQLFGDLNNNTWVFNALTLAGADDVEAAVAEAMIARAQIKPEFANSLSELETSGDKSKLYVLPDGNLYAYVKKTTEGYDYLNQVPISLDKDKTSIFNGVGYKDGYYISDTSESADSAFTTTGYIPYEKDGSGKYPTIYIKGLNWTAESHCRFYVYTSVPSQIWGASNVLNMIGSNANLEANFTRTVISSADNYWKLEPKDAFSTNVGAATVAYIRISLKGKGANLVISIGEPIESKTTTVEAWQNTGHAFVPTDYEDRIRALEATTSGLNSRVNKLEDGGGGGTSGGSTATDGVESYVQEEAERVALEVYSKQNANTFSFLAVSDMHYTDYWGSVAESSLHAGQGMDIVRKNVNIDFAVNLGDVTWGSSVDPVITTQEMGISEIRQCNKFIESAFRGIPNFRTIGNHDNLVYNYDTNGAYLSGDELFPLFGAYNRGAVFPENKAGGYCYRDFEEWKLRVICVNTTEDTANNPADKSNMYASGEQIKWFAETLDLSAKSNSDKWNILIFSHAPIEQMSSTRMSLILEAYVNGTSFNATVDGVSIRIDYSGKNKATVIANIHGHNHNFQVDYLRKLNSDYVTTSPISVKRICVPNACYMRSNERGLTEGVDDWYDVDYGEATTYNKTRFTAQSTSFNVFTIDTKARKIYATNYGAGYDRIISY